MGSIKITTAGSFGEGVIQFSAESGGHAKALSDAIKYLNDRLPEGIRLDHKLHDEGDRPPRGDFGYSPGNPDGVVGEAPANMG